MMPYVVRRKYTNRHSRQKDVTAYADTSPSSALSTFSSASQKHQLNTTTIFVGFGPKLSSITHAPVRRPRALSSLLPCWQ